MDASRIGAGGPVALTEAHERGTSEDPLGRPQIFESLRGFACPTMIGTSEAAERNDPEDVANIRAHQSEFRGRAEPLREIESCGEREQHRQCVVVQVGNRANPFIGANGLAKDIRGRG